MRTAFYGLGLVALISSHAVAGEALAYEGYGFAGEAIGGSYIGAPVSRFPRPAELVPPAWGYGTYGIPTVTGIRQAPTAAPTVTVIETDGSSSRRGGTGARFSARHADMRRMDARRTTAPVQGDVRVIAVTVPRR